MSLPSIERDDEHHQEKHAYILKSISERKIDCVFLGDSITRRWEDNPNLWKYYFGDFYCANFGVGGDTLENLKWRIENGEMKGFAPELIVLLIGTNNLPDYDSDYILEGICEIVTLLKAKQMQSEIVLLGLLPRYPDDSQNDYMKTVTEINKQLESKYSQDEKICFKDLGSFFLPLSRKNRDEYMPDGLHLNANGYKIIGPELKKIIERRLG